jgi:hypothetical protein
LEAPTITEEDKPATDVFRSDAVGLYDPKREICTTSGKSYGISLRELVVDLILCQFLVGERERIDSRHDEVLRLRECLGVFGERLSLMPDPFPLIGRSPA